MHQPRHMSALPNESQGDISKYLYPSPAIPALQFITARAGVHRVTAGTPTHQATISMPGSLLNDFSQETWL